MVVCPKCHGKRKIDIGFVSLADCPKCGATGHIPPYNKPIKGGTNIHIHIHKD